VLAMMCLRLGGVWAGRIELVSPSFIPSFFLKILQGLSCVSAGSWVGLLWVIPSSISSKLSTLFKVSFLLQRTNLRSHLRAFLTFGIGIGLSIFIPRYGYFICHS
jgi:hypothetical protein